MHTVETNTDSKLILVGEHLVVHGFSGIALPFGLKNRIRISTSPVFKVLSTSPAIQTEKFKSACTETAELFTHQPLTIEIFPHDYPGSGLGMSASLGVGLVRTLDQMFPGKDESTLLTICHQWEQHWHKTPSGIDTTTIWENKPLYFEKSAAGAHKQVLDLDTDWIWSNLQVFHTGIPKESTHEMIQIFEQNFCSRKNNTDITQLALVAWKKQNLAALIEALNIAGILLERMGVVSPEVLRVSAKLRDQGCGVKISGAGGRTNGSGALLVFGPITDQSVLETLGADRLFPR